MNKHWLITCFCILFGEMAFAFSPEEAHRLYDEKFKSTSPSVQVCGDYLFVISEGKLTRQRHDDSSSEILSAQLAALEKYVGSGTFGYVSPFGRKMTERLKQRQIDFSIPQCRVITVEESVGEKTFREVSAFERAPIQAERERMLRRVPSRRTVTAWTLALKDLLGKCPTDEMRRHVMLELGCVVPLLFGKGRGCAGTGMLVDGRAVEELFKSSSSLETADQGACLSALRILPSYSVAHRRLATISFEKNDALTCVDECLRSGVAGDVDEVLLNRAVQSLQEQTGCSAWEDFLKVYRQCATNFLSSSWGQSPVRSAVWRALGRLAIDERRESEAQSMFERARNLYRRGRDLPGIIRLLERAIELSPGNAEFWRYYGDALRTNRHWLESVLAYHESLTLGNEDFGMLLDLARVYDKLGLRGMAESVCWWILLQTKEEGTRGGIETLLKEWKPDVFL